MQVMDTYFGCDPLFFQRQEVTEKLHLLLCGKMKYMQAGTIFLCELNGGERRLETGFLIPDPWMVRRHQRPLFFFYIFQVMPDDLFVFTMYSDQNLTIPEQPVQGEVI